MQQGICRCSSRRDDGIPYILVKYAMMPIIKRVLVFSVQLYVLDSDQRRKLAVTAFPELRHNRVEIITK